MEIKLQAIFKILLMYNLYIYNTLINNNVQICKIIENSIFYNIFINVHFYIWS